MKQSPAMQKLISAQHSPVETHKKQTTSNCLLKELRYAASNESICTIASTSSVDSSENKTTLRSATFDQSVIETPSVSNLGEFVPADVVSDNMNSKIATNPFSLADKLKRSKSIMQISPSKQRKISFSRSEGSPSYVKSVIGRFSSFKKDIAATNAEDQSNISNPSRPVPRAQIKLTETDELLEKTQDFNSETITLISSSSEGVTSFIKNPQDSKPFVSLDSKVSAVDSNQLNHSADTCMYSNVKNNVQLNSDEQPVQNPSSHSLTECSPVRIIQTNSVEMNDKLDSTKEKTPKKSLYDIVNDFESPVDSEKLLFKSSSRPRSTSPVKKIILAYNSSDSAPVSFGKTGVKSNVEDYKSNLNPEPANCDSDEISASPPAIVDSIAVETFISEISENQPEPPHIDSKIKGEPSLSAKILIDTFNQKAKVNHSATPSSMSPPTSTGGLSKQGLEISGTKYISSTNEDKPPVSDSTLSLPSLSESFSFDMPKFEFGSSLIDDFELNGYLNRDTKPKDREFGNDAEVNREVKSASLPLAENILNTGTYPPLNEQATLSDSNFEVITNTLGKTISEVTLNSSYDDNNENPTFSIPTDPSGKSRNEVYLQKSVRFASAWEDGALETHHFVCVDESRYDEYSFEPDFLGKLLVSVSKIHLYGSSIGNRVVDLEIEQCGGVIVSPPWTVLDATDGINTDWEFDWAVVAYEPFTFTIRVRQDQSQRSLGSDMKTSFSSSSNLSRSLSTKAKSISSRVFGSFRMAKPDFALKKLDTSGGDELKLNLESDSGTLKNSTSTSSFASLKNLSSISMHKLSNTFRSSSKCAQPAQPNCTRTLKSGSLKIDDLDKWLQPSVGKLTEHSLDLFSKCSEGAETPVGRITFKAILLKPTLSCPMELLPIDFQDYIRGNNFFKIHQKIWKEGYLLQRGGDCTGASKRRYFKLQGHYLVAHHEKTLEESGRICLRLIDALRYVTLPDSPGYHDGFEVEFRDGSKIEFRVDSCDIDSKFSDSAANPIDNVNCSISLEAERDRWMDVIEESLYVLNASPLPPWHHILS